MQLLPISAAITLTVVLAGAAAVGLVAVALAQLATVNLANIRPTATEILEIVKISLAVVAGIGGVVALVVAYRRQRITEAGESREQAKLFNERFATASGRLGDDSPAVRLACIHALAALADDWEGGRQMCIDVLCAYLRMPSAPEPEASPESATHLAWRAMREVRLTIWRLIAAHLKVDAPTPWHGADLDFTGVTIDHNINFASTVFPSGVVRFSGAKFLGGRVRFDKARFSGGSVLFGGAEFSGGEFLIYQAIFSGHVSFTRTKFSGSTVQFGRAVFSGGWVEFDEAEFADGHVGFSGAEFSGSTVQFRRAKFSGGTVKFDGAKFDGGTVYLDQVADWSHPPAGLPTKNVPGLVLCPSASPAAVQEPDQADDSGPDAQIRSS
ncbi:pentapeptide repeat-containing protein [Nonomuraea sp. NPDC047529]|uniref:pentapeptide repeat-containing protein n=1 Tax=Nonomuraea sp. NPDC047529 TaxID=3155623 RepID=UPI0034058031